MRSMGRGFSRIVMYATILGCCIVTYSCNRHEYVDLGLSVKWATCNVGASSPEDYGNYYAWGEIKTKPEYTEENSVTWGKSIGDIVGNANYDAARANWGGSWRMPTYDEIQELINNCTIEWTTQGEHNGFKITGPNGNSIFLPAAGGYSESLRDDGEFGHYWSSSPVEDYTHNVYGLGFYNGDFNWDCDYRYYGHSVRPVCDK